MSTTLLNLRPELLSTTPPDKFRFTVPEDGCVIVAFDRGSWFSQIQDHYRWNGYPLPENWRALAEDQLCQSLPGEWCQYGDGSDYEGGVDPRFGIGDIINGTRVMASFTLGGMKTVSQEVAEERALTCARCHMNAPVPGCSACVGLLNVVAEVIGNKSTKSDATLKQCMICHCSNKAQVWLQEEDLAKGVTAEQRVQFSRVPHCWKKLGMPINSDISAQ